MQDLRIMVTGIAGLIGSWIAEGLIKEGTKVIGVDDLSGGFIENVPTWLPQSRDLLEFHQVDISDYRKIEEVFAQTCPQCIVHCAAVAREGASEFQPYKITKSNILISSILLELGVKYKMKRFVFLSSMSCYGDGKKKPPFDEKMPRMPVDPYGVSKAATEAIVEQLAETHGFEYVIIRPHNCTGPRQMINDRYRNVAGIFMNSIMRQEPLALFGKDHRRAFSYIEDALPAFLSAIGSEKANGEIINVGGKEQITVSELAEEIIKNMPEYPRPQIVQLPARPHEVAEAFCTTEKSELLLGYKEKYGWREGIRRMCEWAKEQGPRPWVYDYLPLLNEKAPLVWRPE